MTGGVAEAATAWADAIIPRIECSCEAAWLEHRAKGIGASDAAVVYGENPYKSVLQLYCEKAGISAADDLSGVEAVEWGHRLQRPVADKYVQETGREIADIGAWTIVVHPERAWQRATLDYVIAPCDGHDGPGVLEVKTCGARHAEEWEEGVPRTYWIQVQHQLAVTGLSWGSLAVLIGGQAFRWMDVERDEAFIQSLTETEAAFMESVRQQIPPPPDGSASARAALASMYPEDSGESVALPGVAIDWDNELDPLKDQIKALEARKAELENLIKGAIGDATTGVLPNGVSYTFKAQTRAEHIVKESTFRVLRRKAAKKEW